MPKASKDTASKVEDSALDRNFILGERKCEVVSLGTANPVPCGSVAFCCCHDLKLRSTVEIVPVQGTHIDCGFGKRKSESPVGTAFALHLGFGGPESKAMPVPAHRQLGALEWFAVGIEDAAGYGNKIILIAGAWVGIPSLLTGKSAGPTGIGILSHGRFVN